MCPVDKWAADAATLSKLSTFYLGTPYMWSMESKNMIIFISKQCLEETAGKVKKEKRKVLVYYTLISKIIPLKK